MGCDGWMYQGYFKDDIYYMYGRSIYSKGDIYEGGWYLYTYHGKGVYEYRDRTKEIGQWVKNKKQGEFQIYDKSGTLTHTKIYKDDKEIECEEVKK